MFKNILFVLVSLFAFNAFAHHTDAAMAKALGRPLTLEEVASLEEIEQTLIQAESKAVVTKTSATSADAFRDERSIGYNFGCLTVKGGLVLVSSQQLVCTNIFEVYTISKSVGLGSIAVNDLSLSANAGIVYAHMNVNQNANARLQSFQLLDEPVDTIGLDYADVFGVQAVLFSSPNVALQIYGLTMGFGGGYTLEQSGNVPRELFDGSTLNIKKFNF